jgi:hypothetical protein
MAFLEIVQISLSDLSWENKMEETSVEFQLFLSLGLVLHIIFEYI